MESLEFHDFDAFASSISGIDSRMLLRDPECRAWTIDRIELPGLKIQIGRLGSGNIASGQKDRDGWMLYLPLTSGIEYRGNGDVIDRDSFFIIEPGAEFYVSTKLSHDWCALSISNQLMNCCFESPSRTCRVTQPNPVAAYQVRNVVGDIMATAANCSEFESSPAASLAASKLLGLVSTVLGKPPKKAEQTKGRPQLSRDEVIRHALGSLEEFRCNRPTIAELASQSGVSERTLRTAFQQYFGMGPSRYLQLRQLHDVHRSLQSADPDHKSVAQVLTAHGVWSFGRFASHYFGLFDELPSVTLRRRSKS